MLVGRTPNRKLVTMSDSETDAGIRAVLWDFGGVILSSPFEAFNRYERANDLPSDFIRSVNTANADDNAWARLERNDVTPAEFDAGCSPPSPRRWAIAFRAATCSGCSPGASVPRW